MPRTLHALLALPLLACAPREASRAPNVLLICIDTLRADRLGCYGYERHASSPALDALAERSIVFEDCSATAGWTKPSVPSLLTGTFPAQHGVYEGSARSQDGLRSDVLPEEALTLAEVFRAAGWQTAAFVRNAQLRAGLGFEQGFELYRDEAGDAREIRWRARDWLEERDPRRPFFLYLHLLDVHWPYPIPDEYAARFTSPEDVALFRQDDWRGLRDAIDGGSLRLEPAQLDALEALYAGAIRYADDELGRLLALLERSGLAEDTIVCVVSDHGEEFLEHGRLGHGHGLSQELLRVPWILHVPGRAPARVTTPASTVDLFPTLLAAAGLGLDAVARERLCGVERLSAPDAPGTLLAEHKAPDAYEQVLRRGQVRLWRRFEPGEPREETSGRGLADLRLGARYQAELDPGAREPRALELALREGDPDEHELKGVVHALDGARFTIGGLAVEREPGCELYGATSDADRRPRPLADGLMVKAVGRFADGALHARRLKLYEPEARAELELRGPLEELQQGPGGARARIAGFWIALDERTVVEQDVPRGLERSALPEILATGTAPGLAVRRELARVGSDRLALAPLEEPALAAELEARLDELGLRLSALSSWGDAAGAVLDEGDLEALRALGYVR